MSLQNTVLSLHKLSCIYTHKNKWNFETSIQITQGWVCEKHIFHSSLWGLELGFIELEFFFLDKHSMNTAIFAPDGLELSSFH